MEIEIEKSDSSERIKTCFFYDPNVAKIGFLDELAKGNLNDLTKKNEDNNINYNFIIYSENKEAYSYNSKTRIIREIRNDTFNHSLLGKIIFIDCILVIIFFILKIKDKVNINHIFSFIDN